MSRQIWEIEVDGQQFDAEPNDKGIMFYKKGSNLPWLSIVWQDIYSAAWNFAQIRADYDKKTSG